MRHRYETRGIVLSRAPLGEVSTLLTILTPQLGLIRARAQGLRRPGAKLSAALATFAESSLIVVRGAEGWRIAGAVLEENWFKHMNNSVRTLAARITGLLLRLSPGETHEPDLYSVVTDFFGALSTLPEDLHEPAEVLAALRVLNISGLDAGEVPAEAFTEETLQAVRDAKMEYISRINRGIAASGL